MRRISLLAALLAAACAAEAPAETTQHLTGAPQPPGGSVAVDPASATVPAQAAQSFACTVGGVATTCSWGVDEAAGGTVDTGGVYTAPGTPGVFHVAATVGGITARATITVTSGTTPGLAAALATLAGRKTYVAHNSVGGQMLQGVYALASANGVALTTRYRGDLSSYNGVSEDEVGTNGQPLGKVDDFVGREMPAYGSKAQFAMMKFCFVDFMYSYTPQQIFDKYKAAAAALKVANPGITFVHFTAPLCNATDANGDPASALARHTYNEMVRAEYQGKEPLFDMALSEATDGNGVVQTKVLSLSGSPTVQVRAAGWDGADNCHIGTAGQQHVGADFVRYLATLPTP